MPRSYIRKQQLKKYHKRTFYISTNRWTKNTAENVKLGMEARKANMQRTSKSSLCSCKWCQTGYCHNNKTTTICNICKKQIPVCEECIQKKNYVSKKCNKL